MAVFSYLPIFFITIQATYISSSFSLHPPTNIALLQRKTASPPHLIRRGGAATEGIKIDQGFWYADFSVGGSSNLSLLIDTGSGDVVLNPGVYLPGKTSQNLNITFENTYGTTSSNGTGNGNVTGELYIDQVSFGDLTTKQIVGSATDNSLLPSSGIVGFSGQIFSQFPNSTNATPFIQSLCNQNVVSECRFGLALTDSGTGTLALGELDSSLYTGDLVVAPVLEQWVLNGDLAINGNIVASDLVIELDSGTATVVGPIDAVTNIFNATGVQAILQSTSEGDLLTGYFPCDKPPTIGFSFPSQKTVSQAANDSTSPISKKSSTFNIPSNAWAAANNGNNNCTAVLSGQNYAAFPGLWVVGQSFFQGLYIDHNLENGTMGFAPLKAQASENGNGNVTSTSSPTSSPKPTQSTSDAGTMHGSWGLIFWTLILAAYLVAGEL